MKQKIKVFEVIPTLGGGGAEKVVIELADGLDNNLFDVTIISLYDSTYAIDSRVAYCEQKGIKIVYLNKKSGFDFGLLRRLVQLISKEKPDVVHTHLYSYKYVVLLDAFFKYKHIHTFHSTIGYERGIFDFLLKVDSKIGKTHFAVLVERFIIDMQKRYHVKNERVSCIHNGIDETLFCKKDRLANKENITFITVGSLISVKNHDCLLAAFEKLEKRRNNQDLLYIIGDGDRKAELVDICRNKGIDQNVVFTGNVSNVVDYLHKADVYVCSSHFEGMSLAIVEAASTGLPLICSNTGGTGDVVGENAVLFNDNDSDKLEELMYQMATDYEYRKDYTNRAVKLSMKYTQKTMVRNYEKLYTDTKQF